MLRCIHGAGGGMLTFMWSAYSVDATLHTWGGGGMLTFMWSAYGVDATLHTWGGGGMLTFMWSAYSVDATLHTWGVGPGHVNVHVKCIRCRCYVAYMGWGGHVNVHVKCIQCRCYVAYMGWGGHVNVHVKCIRCRCYVAYMGWGGMLTFMWSAYGVDATMHTWRVHVRCPWMPCACACGAMYGCGTGDTGSRVKDPMF